MKSGYYVYNDDIYNFELDNNYITVVNKEGTDWQKFIDVLNGKYEESTNMQILQVKIFPDWHDAIIFHNHNLESIGAVSSFRIYGIIEFKTSIEQIDEINIYSTELDYMYNSSKVFQGIGRDEKGNISLSIKPFKETDSKIKKLKMKDKIINYSFEIDKKFSTEINKYFSANTKISYKCDNLSQDYLMIYELAEVTHMFMAYIYYRKNIVFNKISLQTKNKDSKYYETATMTIFEDETIKPEEDYIKRYHIKYDEIKEVDDKILQAIIDNKLFIRNIPDNEIKRNQVTPQSFIMVSSAFEWEFNQLFPRGVEHKKKKVEAIKNIKEKLENISIEDITEKSIMNNIIKHVGQDNLESKIIFANNKLKELSNIFLEQLCNWNKIDNKNEIFTSLQKLRNDCAHGNMDIDVDSDGFVGIIYLERLVYIMQLKRFGLKDENIKKSVNDLFDSRLAL